MSDATAGKATAASAGFVAGDAAPVKQSRPGRTSQIGITGGKRTIVSYIVTDGELSTLGQLQGGSNVAFGVAGSALGFWLSTRQAVDFVGNSEAMRIVIAKWQAYGNAALFITIVSAILGGWLWRAAGTKVRSIKEGTEHH